MDLPIRRKSFGSLRRGSLGTGIAAAAVASSPYERRRPDGWCVTTLLDAEQVEGSTPHCRAAAPTIISRAAAPAVRKVFQEFPTLKEPPVIWSGNAGSLYIGSAGALSKRTL